MRSITVLALTILVSFVCSAQQKDNNASALTGSQAKQVAKILKRHNVMVDFCGCCEKSSPQYIKIEKVMSDSIGVTVTGLNIANGAKYIKTVDVAEVWLPQLKDRRISTLKCVGQSAGIPCDPCTAPLLPTGALGDKFLAMELDGLMEATGGKSEVSLQRKDNVNGKDVMVERKAERVAGQAGDGKSTMLKKQVPLERKRFGKVEPLRRGQ